MVIKFRVPRNHVSRLFLPPPKNLLYFLRTGVGFCNRRRNEMNEVLSTENVSPASPERGFWKYISFKDIQNNLT